MAAERRGYSALRRAVYLLHCVLEHLARPELGLRAGLDLHRLAGAGIAARRSLAPGYRKIPKADEAHLVSPLQRRRDYLEHRFDCAHRIVAAKARAVGDMTDQFLLVHAPALPHRRQDSHARSVGL